MYWATWGTSSTTSSRVWSGHRADSTTRRRHPCPARDGPVAGPPGWPARRRPSLVGASAATRTTRSAPAVQRPEVVVARELSTTRPGGLGERRQLVRRRRAAAGPRRTQRTAARPGAAASKIVVRRTTLVAGVVDRAAGLVTVRAGPGSSRIHSSDEAAVVARQVVRVGQPGVDDRQAARRQVRGQRRDRAACSRARAHQEQRVEGDDRQPVARRRRRGAPCGRRPRRGAGDARRRRPAASAARLARASIAGSMSTPVTASPAAARGTAIRPRAAGELQDRAAGPAGQREVQVEVARVLGEVQVVEPGKRVGRRGLGRSRQRRRRRPRPRPAVAGLP